MFELSIVKYYNKSTITNSIKNLVEKRLILEVGERKYVISGPGDNFITNVLKGII